MKRLFVLGSVFFLSASLLPAQSQGDLERVVAVLNSMSGFRANISFGNTASQSRGVLSYQGGRFHLKFSDGRVIASNGREVVVYNPGSGVAGKQPIVPGKGGIGWILGYQVTGGSGNSATLKPGNAGSGYQEVRVTWGEGHVLRRLSVRSKNQDDFFTITLSDIRKVDSFPAQLFSYRPPPGSRTVDSPLDQDM